MSEGVMIALITGGLAVISNIIVAVINGAKTLYRIDQLEKKVEKHNNLVERMIIVEETVKDQEEKIEEIKTKLP